MRSEDAERLAVLWTAAQSEVRAFLRSVLDAGDVADVLQQVAVRLVRKFSAYDPERPFVPWAIGVAKNEVLAWRRKQAIDRHRFSDETVTCVADAFAESSDSGGDLHEALAHCLGQLEGRGKKALDLHYGEGLKTDRVAAALKMSAGAARMLLCRAREVLRGCIQRRLNARGETV